MTCPARPRTFAYFVSFVLVAWAISSCVVSDGPLELVSGRPPDAGVVRDLESRRATTQEVEGRLGPPSERTMEGNEVVLAYRSVRARTSTESVAGATIRTSRQEVWDTWELRFDNDRLTSAHSSSKVVDKP